MTEATTDKKRKTCCFTGHRKMTDKEKLSCSKRISHLVDTLVHIGVTEFITGGALGFDTVACVTLINIKRQKYPHINITVAVPCKDQSQYWSIGDKAIYSSTLKYADRVVVLSEKYTSTCMQERNRYMVDHSKYCISYLKTQSGGTYNTVRYAKKCGVAVINLAEPVWDKI